MTVVHIDHCSSLLPWPLLSQLVFLTVAYLTLLYIHDKQPLPSHPQLQGEVRQFGADKTRSPQFSISMFSPDGMGEEFDWYHVVVLESFLLVFHVASYLNVSSESGSRMSFTMFMKFFSSDLTHAFV